MSDGSDFLHNMALANFTPAMGGLTDLERRDDQFLRIDGLSPGAQHPIDHGRRGCLHLKCSADTPIGLLALRSEASQDL